MKSKPLHGLFKIGLVLSIFLALTFSSLPQFLGNTGEVETTRAQESDQISSDWLANAQKTIQQMEYHISWVDEPLIAGAAAGFQAPNRAHNLRFYFQPDGIQVIQRDTMQPAWVWRLALAGIGRSDAIDSVGQGVLVSEANLITYQFGTLEQSLVNSELGLQQTITVYNQPPPKNAALLVLSQQVAEDFSMQRVSGGGVQISFNELPVMEYKLQNVVDASGKQLEAHLEVQQSMDNSAGSLEMLLVIDDNQAKYPLQIQALLSGINPVLDWNFDGASANAFLGYSVATAGDVNGDGYSDIIIGAPGYDYNGTDAGMACVFHGSPTVPRFDAPDWIKYGNSISNPLRLGESVATAGDVNGDGYSDVIIGVPYDSNYAGFAFVHHGSPSGLSAPSTPDWVFPSSQSYAYLGSSVATAGDLNGDGYSDVVVGAPYHNDFSEQSGRAYVQYGSATGLDEGYAWYVEGIFQQDRIGWSVATAGDVNADGYADLLVGSPYVDLNVDKQDSGRVDLYLGRQNTEAAPGVYRSFYGTNGGDHFGWSISTAGDVNGDGFADILIGAPRADIHVSSVTAEGEAYLFYGWDDMDTTVDWYTRGDVAQGKLGYSVATVGDVNADGYSDIIIGQPFYEEMGRALVFFGGAMGIGEYFTLPSNADWIAVNNSANSRFGCSVATGGDVNGDGWSDILIGASHYTGGATAQGRAYLWYGGWVTLSDTVGWTYSLDNSPESPDKRFGWSVASAGDVNADGFADIIIGAPFFDSSFTNEGRAYVFHGASDGISWTTPWFAQGNQANAYFGYSVASAGDVNGDGYSDVIIGAPYLDNTQQDEGMAFVWLGSSTGLGTNSSNPIADADWYAESNWAVSYLGASVASAGDVNGDGYGDIVIGAPACNRYGVVEAGHVLVWHGFASGLGANGTLENADWRMIGNYANGRLGSSVSSAGDVNRDGFSDVIAGGTIFAKAWYGSPQGLHKVDDWIIFGPDSTQVNSVSTAGDINGDGYSDIVFGAPNKTLNVSQEGAVYAYCGSANGLPGAWSVAPAYACWYDYGNLAGAHLGTSVSTAGDVNGDGYADIIAGAPDWANPVTGEGQARVYYGADGGPIVNSHGDWKVDGGVVSNLGYSVASAGDVNGDGFADVLIGSPSYDYNGGKADLYFGNGAMGRSYMNSQLRPGYTPLHNLGGVHNGNFFILYHAAFSPSGKSRAESQFEVKQLGTNFNGGNLIKTNLGMLNTPQTYVYSLSSNNLVAGSSYHWRLRYKYSPVTSPFVPYSRWIHIPWSGWNEADLRRPVFINYLPIILR